MQSIDEANAIITLVQSHGFYAWLRLTDPLGTQILCCSKLADGTYHGTSFWIALIHDICILGSFGYRQWRAPSQQDILDSAIEWLRAESGPGAPPSSVIHLYKLEEFEDDEFDEFLKTGVVPEKM